MTASQVQKVLITGASGFIGRHVTDACSRLGQEVVAIAGPTRPELPADSSSVQWVQLDLREPQGIATLLSAEKPDVVFHLAATSRWCQNIRGFERVDRDLSMAQNLFAAVNAVNFSPTVVVASAGAMLEAHGYVDTPYPCRGIQILDFDMNGRPLAIIRRAPAPGQLIQGLEYRFRAETSSDWLRSKMSVDAFATHAQSEGDADVHILRLFCPIGPGLPEGSLFDQIIGWVRDSGLNDAPSPTAGRYDAYNCFDVRDLGELIARYPERVTQNRLASAKHYDNLLEPGRVLLGLPYLANTSSIASGVASILGLDAEAARCAFPDNSDHGLTGMSSAQDVFGDDGIHCSPLSVTETHGYEDHELPTDPVSALYPDFQRRSLTTSLEDLLGSTHR